MHRVMLFVLLLFTGAGCAGKDPLVPVRGRITLDGKPLKDVIVTFTPIGDTRGNGALGGTDADGRFTLTDVRGSAGAVVGEYKVSLYPAPASSRRDDPADVVSKGGLGVPAIYLDLNNTPLRATIPPGGGTVELLLTGSGKGATTKSVPHTPAG